MSRSTLAVTAVDGGDVRFRRTGDAPGGRGHLAFRTLARSSMAAEVALVAEGALLLAGDDIVLDVRVGSGVCLTVIEPAGTVAFDMRGGSARWDVTVEVEDGAQLLWYAEPFVIASGAEVSRSVTVRLHGSGRYAARETLVLGRCGEHGGRLHQRTDIRDDEGPLLIEDLQVDGAQPQVGVLGGARVMDTLGFFGRSGPRTPGGATRLDLDRGGHLLRALVDQTHVSPLGGVPLADERQLSPAGAADPRC